MFALLQILVWLCVPGGVLWGMHTSGHAPAPPPAGSTPPLPPCCSGVETGRPKAGASIVGAQAITATTAPHATAALVSFTRMMGMGGRCRCRPGRHVAGARTQPRPAAVPPVLHAQPLIPHTPLRRRCRWRPHGHGRPAAPPRPVSVQLCLFLHVGMQGCRGSCSGAHAPCWHARMPPHFSDAVVCAGLVAEAAATRASMAAGAAA